MTNYFVERSHFKVNEVSSFLLVNTNIQRFTSDIFPAGNVLEMLGEHGGNVEGGAVHAVSLEKAVMGTGAGGSFIESRYVWV